MKLKLTVTFGMAMFYILPIIFTFSISNFWMSKEAKDPDSNPDDIYYSFYYILYSFVWGCIGLLMRYEHSKNLYEVWYC